MPMNIDQAFELYQEIDKRKRFEHWRYWKPVPKHREFMEAGVTYAERMLRAGNGCGKTECGAFEVSRHVTGEYPSWWKGYRFNKPIVCWIGGITAERIRETTQTKLFGPPGDPEGQGTAMLPKDAIIATTASRGAANGIDSATVRHVSGKMSRIIFKTYEQGRANWQGSDVDLVWFDEEPEKMDVYVEGSTRLRGRGISLTTFTPLFGRTELVMRFEQEDSLRKMVTMGLRDATWYTPGQVEQMVSRYRAHERVARIEGLPFLGEGAVFDTPAEQLMEPPIRFSEIPKHWPLLWGVDFGIDHPFAAVLMAWDRDSDTIHILHTIKIRDANALQHAHALRQIAANVPVAWPHDGNARDKGSGEQLSKIYRGFGLNMLGEHATHETGGYQTEAGIVDMSTYMQGGRFKVADTLTEWFQEYMSYYRKNGQIVKVNDDLMSATRTAHIMRRKARIVPLGSKLRRPTDEIRIARDVDFPLFA